MVYKICIILFVIVHLRTSRAGHGFSQEKAEATPIHLRHGVLTLYKDVGNYDASELNFPGCEPQKLWIFARHGTRYPFEATISDIICNLPSIKNCMKASYTDIKHWNPLFRYNKHGKMMARGESELLELGERFRSRLPSLITDNCNENTYKYDSTSTHRTKLSARQFGIGLLGERFYRKCWQQEPTDKKLVLEFYNHCAKWKRDIRNNWEVKREERRFTESDHVKKMLRDVSERIGLQIDFYDVSLIHHACAYESAFHEDEMKSPWCSVLLPRELEILEYRNDLYSYWVHGYGYSLTYKQACPMLVDMFQFFESPSADKVRAYFGHDTGMWKIVALLGIHHDEHPLLSDSFLHAKHRKWKSSFISPFAANIAFVSYKCGESGQTSILFLHQEHIVSLPGCPVGVPCPLHIMKNLYPSTTDECKFEEMCAV